MKKKERALRSDPAPAREARAMEAVRLRLAEAEAVHRAQREPRYVSLAQVLAES